MGPASPKAGRSLCSVGETGLQEREEGLEQEGAALSLSWVLPLSKPPLISMPWVPNCKMEDQMG